MIVSYVISVCAEFVVDDDLPPDKGKCIYNGPEVRDQKQYNREKNP